MLSPWGAGCDPADADTAEEAKLKSTFRTSRTAMTPPTRPATDRAMVLKRDDVFSFAAKAASN
ncbi:hypothetical protein D3C75_1252640 [compost metagenome]